MNVLFHLAFPVHDFKLAKYFYQEQLGFEVGRESEHALIFQFGAHQIVAHKTEAIPVEQQGIYPRHFGLIFLDSQEYIDFIQRVNAKGIDYYIPLKVRFPGTRVEHQSFFLKDPSNNLLEFKHYTYQSAIFNEKDFKKIGDTK